MTSIHAAVDNDVLGVKKERSLSPFLFIYQLFLTKVTHAFHGKLAGDGFTVLTVTQSSND